MTHWYRLGAEPEEAARALDAWLSGELPETPILGIGQDLYFLSHLPAMGEMETLSIAGGPVKQIKTEVEPGRSRLSVSSWFGHRHLPRGVAVAADADGLYVLSADHIFVEGAAPWTLPNPLDDIWTGHELASAFGIPFKKVVSDIEMDNGPFQKGEARKSGTEWLILKTAARRVYGKEETVNPLPNPLLRSFTTVEAASIWGRDNGDVRSAASGAGHRAARMGDGDRRRAGRTWLVNLEAMERLFGTPQPERWQEAMRHTW
jgi:hypothetical protein